MECGFVNKNAHKEHEGTKNTKGGLVIFSFFVSFV